MNNIYLYEYLSGDNNTKQHIYNKQRKLIKKDIFKLNEYIDTQPDLKIKGIVEIEENMYSPSYKQMIFKNMFKHINKIASTDDKSIFVILTGDEKKFSLLFTSCFDSYVSTRKRLDTSELYNRLIIKFSGPHSYCELKDVFYKTYNGLFDCISQLFSMETDEQFNKVVKMTNGHRR